MEERINDGGGREGGMDGTGVGWRGQWRKLKNNVTYDGCR